MTRLHSKLGSVSLALLLAALACGTSSPPPSETAPPKTPAAAKPAAEKPARGSADRADRHEGGNRHRRQGSNNKNKMKPSPAQATHSDLRAGEQALGEAFRAQKSGVWVEAAGKVDRVLPEDKKGSPHQRFIVRLRSGQTVLISHNVNLAFRVPVDVGSEVRFRGEYRFQKRGGVIHWTHHDPTKKRQGGWIEHNGKRYE